MWIGKICALTIGLVLGSGACAQSTIELRSSAHAAPGSAITLAQVARLEGTEALALAATQISAAAAATITLDEVRQALDSSGRINWGRISLRGGTCTLLGPAPEPKPRTADPAPEASPAANTLRAAICTHLARMLKVEPDELRVTFATEDVEFLATPTTGRTVEVHPTAMADKMPLRIALYERDRLIGNERTIRVSITTRRECPVAISAKRRGETITPDDYSVDSRWVGPTTRPATAEQLAGAAARDRINAGQVIEFDDAVPAFVVGKGDIVSVRCLSGGVIVGTRARALAPARDGELVEFQALDSKRRFFARMDGRGRAIISADPAPQPDSQSGFLPVSGSRIPPPSSLEASR